jgi:hypothetical protein
MGVTFYHWPNREHPVLLNNISCILEGTHMLSTQLYIWKAVCVGRCLLYGNFGSCCTFKNWSSKKNFVFWDWIFYRPMKVKGGFGERYCLHLLAARFMLVSCVTYFSSWSSTQYILPKRRFTVNWPYYFISLKVQLLIDTAARTLNPT